MSTQFKREALSKIVNLVRPALATSDYIPALTMVKFDGKYATAYNDIAAIRVKADVDLNLCVPGETLIKALGSFSGDSLMIQEDAKNKSLLVASGKSKFKLPTLPGGAHPFEMPDGDGDTLDINDDILKGIEQCLMSVGTNTKHPSQMGVTLEALGGVAVLCSTDNKTISRFQTKTKLSLPGDVPVILPTFFCQQLIALAKHYSESDITLLLSAGALIAEFGKDAFLMTKTPVDLEPLDFDRIIKKTLANQKVSVTPIPDAFDAALGRALLVLSQEAEKETHMNVDSEGLSMRSVSSLGESDDQIKMQDLDECSFTIDPTLVLRASKVCTHIGFYREVLVLANKDATFLHLIAHCK